MHMQIKSRGKKMTTAHELRIFPQPFKAIRQGKRMFLCAYKQDGECPFEIGDSILIQEMGSDSYDTGRDIPVVVTCIIDTDDFPGLCRDAIILGIEEL